MASLLHRPDKRGGVAVDTERGKKWLAREYRC